MKPFHAFAMVCLLPLTVLTVVGIAAARALPTGMRVEMRDARPAGEPLPAQDPAAKEGEHAEDPLHEAMEALQAGMKEMRKMLGKPEQKAELLALVAKMEASALACVTLLPEPAAPLTDPVALATWRIDYQRRMVTVYDTLLQLELTVHKDDADGAKELYKKLGEQKQSGHDAFQAE